MKIILIVLALPHCNFVDPPKKTNNFPAIAAFLLLSRNSSPANSATTNVSDSSLYRESIATTSLTIFPNTPSTIFNSFLADRAHGDSILMRLNSMAKNSIDPIGKKPINNSFAEGSLIVKERYSSGNLVQIISMKKTLGFASGWAWGEYSPSGTVQYSITSQGSSCINCHSRGKDYVRIFEY